MTLHQQRAPDEAPRLSGFKDVLRLLICGYCMGAADLVPGISGGTVAFITGIYGDLMDSLKTFNFSSLALFLCGRFRDFDKVAAWRFMAVLIIGIATAILSLAQFISYLLGDEFYRTLLYSGFLGLVIASVIFCAKQLKHWRLPQFAALLAGGIAAFLLTGADMVPAASGPTYDVFLGDLPAVSTRAKPAANYDRSTGEVLGVTDSILAAMLAKEVIGPDTPVYLQGQSERGTASEFISSHYSMGIDPWVAACGLIAVSAMLLPGISGSYLLTILGMYGVVIGALADFIHGAKNFHFEKEAFYILLSMFLGILLGALLFSRVVSWFLKKYHDATVACLTGFMVGALRSVWPFWNYAYVLNPLKLDNGLQLEPINPVMPEFSSALFIYSVIVCCSGFALVFIVERLAYQKRRG